MKILKSVIGGTLLGAALLFSGNAMAYYGYGYGGYNGYGCNGLHTCGFARHHVVWQRSCVVRPYVVRTVRYVQPTCGCNTCGLF